MTKKLGLILIALAFLYGSFVLVREVPEGGAPVRWGPWGVAMFVGVLGIALARSGTRSALVRESAAAQNLDLLNASLGRIISGLDDICARKEQTDVYELRGEIDRLLAEPLGAFADARESMIPRFGLQFYANAMSHFAAGERHVNRVWCCSTDGYVDEAHTYLDRASTEFQEVERQLAEVDG